MEKCHKLQSRLVKWELRVALGVGMRCWQKNEATLLALLALALVTPTKALEQGPNLYLLLGPYLCIHKVLFI